MNYTDFIEGSFFVSLNFGTENIYFVPEGNKFHFFDIYNMRKLEFDFSSWSIFFNKHRFDAIRDTICFAINDWEKNKKDTEETADAGKICNNFINSVPLGKYPDKNFLDLNKIVSPQKILFWTRCSDKTLESFFKEDYSSRKKVPGKKYSIPLVGSFFVSSIDDYELNIVEKAEPQGFFIDLPKKNGISVHLLSPLELLPFHEEFFGAYGSSGMGRAVNLTSDAKIARENLCCTPLNRIGSDFFTTLYFHIRTNLKHKVIFRLNSMQTRQAAQIMANNGFEILINNSGNYVFRRKDSLVHLYLNAMGKETMKTSFLPPFFFISLNCGSIDPEIRSELRDEISELFVK
jgi:hypothetical protein